MFLLRNGGYLLILYIRLERSFRHIAGLSKNIRIARLRCDTTRQIIVRTIVILSQTTLKTVYLLKVAKASEESALILI